MEKKLYPLNLQFFADGEELGANETDTADQSEVATEEQTTDTEPSEPTGNEPTPQDDTPPTPVQSAEDNTKFATARRQAEREFTERQKSVDLEYQRRFSGYVNPLTNQPIRSQKDYLDALDAQEVVKQRQELQEKGIDPDMLSQIVSRQVENNPVVRQAQEVMQRTINEQSNQMIKEDIKEIMRLDPSVKSMEDIAKLPNISQILSLTTEKNISFSDAFKLVNMDSLINNKAVSAKQAAINNIKGTQHLNATNNVATPNTLVDVPKTTLTKLREFYPELTDEQITKKYNETL